MSDWRPIARVEECPPGSCREFVAQGRIVALFNVDGEFHALDGVCPHQGGPLGKGRLDGSVVTCPWHGWQFDAGTGKHVTSPIVQPGWPVRVEEGQVFVDFSEH